MTIKLGPFAMLIDDWKDDVIFDQYLTDFHQAAPEWIWRYGSRWK